MRDAATTFLIRAAGAVVALALQALLARLMAADSYGQYVMFWSVLLTCGSFLSLGLAETAVRFLPRYEIRGRHGQVAAFFSFGMRTTLVFAMVVAVTAGLLLHLGNVNGLGALALPLVAGLVCLALEFYLEGIARALGWFRLTSLAYFIVQPLAIGAITLALHLNGQVLTAFTMALVLATVLAVISLGLYVIVRSRLRGARGRHNPSARLRRVWMSRSLPVLVASALDDLIAHGDIILVGLLLGPSHAAIYFAITRIMVLANFAIYAVQFVSARRFSRSLAGADAARSHGDLRQATLVSLGGTGLALVATTVLSPWLLQIFGPAFVTGYLPVALLAAAVLARSVGVQAAEFLLVSGRLTTLITSHAAALVTLITMLVTLAPTLGLPGAALAALAANLIRSVIQLHATGMLPLSHLPRRASAVPAPKSL